jgi:hypothetical protein
MVLEPTQPPIQWVPGALSLEVKRPGCEADHSAPSNAEVNNEWSYTSISQYVSMAWCSVESTRILLNNFKLLNVLCKRANQELHFHAHSLGTHIKIMRLISKQSAQKPPMHWGRFYKPEFVSLPLRHIISLNSWKGVTSVSAWARNKN